MLKKVSSVFHENFIKSLIGVSRVFQWSFVLPFCCSMNLIAAALADGGLAIRYLLHTSRTSLSIIPHMCLDAWIMMLVRFYVYSLSFRLYQSMASLTLNWYVQTVLFILFLRCYEKKVHQPCHCSFDKLCFILIIILI